MKRVAVGKRRRSKRVEDPRKWQKGKKRTERGRTGKKAEDDREWQRQNSGRGKRRRCKRVKDDIKWQRKRHRKKTKGKKAKDDKEWPGKKSGREKDREVKRRQILDSNTGDWYRDEENYSKGQTSGHRTERKTKLIEKLGVGVDIEGDERKGIG